jgi:D-serine deaminase-like pyridoxal phosphate-dependent protein
VNLASIDTPFVAVDLDVFESNVELAFKRLRDVDVRPHMKTSKTPAVAARLLAAGAVGVCVATLGEAEALVAAGIDDLLITSEIAGAAKVARLARVLESGARVRVVVDSVAAAAALPGPVEALIDVNVGQNRTGVEPDDAVALARAVAEHVRVVGVQGYEGNLQHIAAADERRARVDEAMRRLYSAVTELRDVEVVTTGGTGTADLCAAHDFVTEVQPGSFIFGDASYGAIEGVPYASALKVVATVISSPSDDDRIVVDAGLKAVSEDSGDAVLASATGSYSHAGDEHGIVRGSSLAIGSRVELIPSHIDTTVNLHGQIYAHRGGEVEEVWPVARR